MFLGYGTARPVHHCNCFSFGSIMNQATGLMLRNFLRGSEQEHKIENLKAFQLFSFHVSLNWRVDIRTSGTREKKEIDMADYKTKRHREAERE